MEAQIEQIAKEANLDIKEIGIVPPHNPNLILSKEYKKTLETIEQLVNLGEPVLIQGHAGVGKNQAICEVAHKLNKKVIKINCTGDMKTSTLIGRINAVIETDKVTGEKRTVITWQDGLIPLCLKNEYWLVMDEVNSLDPDILFVLHGLLDDGYLTIANNSEIIKAKPGFRILATMNPNYHGVKSLNQAFIDRWSVIEMDFDKVVDAKLLERMNAPEPVRKAVESLIKKIRERYDTEDITQNFGHRTLDKVVVLSKVFTIPEAMDMAFANKLPIHERGAVKTLIKELAQEIDRVEKTVTTEGNVDAKVKESALTPEAILDQLMGKSKP